MNKLYRITLDATKTLLATEDFVQTFHSVEELTKNITEPVIVVVDGINIADCYEAKILKDNDYDKQSLFCFTSFGILNI